MSTMDELVSQTSEEKYNIDAEIDRLLKNWCDTENNIKNFINSFPRNEQEKIEKKRRAGEIFQRLDEIKNRLFLYYGPGLELCDKLKQMKIPQAPRFLVGFLNSVQHYMDELNKIK